MKQSVAGIVYDKGKFLIGLRLPKGEMGGRWEFPGGKVDGGESPEEAIVREFREEMGIEASPGAFIASVDFRNKGGQVALLAYSVSLSGLDRAFLTEHLRLDWATLDEIERLDFVDSDRLLVPYLRKWCANK